MSVSSPASITRPTTLAILICLAAFVLYQVLIQSYPGVYWGDAHIRLALRDQILVGHWLPLLQILIFGVSKISTDLLVIRSLLALIAIGALAGMYHLGCRLFSPVVGLIAMALLAVNIMFVALAIVPYTELLFTGLILFALYLTDHPEPSPRFYLGVLALNLACLTRYEGWLLAAIFMMEAIGRSLQSRDWKRIILEVPRKVFLYGFGPLTWLVFGVREAGGLIDQLKAIIAFEAQTGNQSLSDRFLSSFNVDYLLAFASSYYHRWEWQAGLGMIVLGSVGLFFAIIFAQRRAPHWRILAFIVSDWLLLALWQPQDFTNLRTAFLGEVFSILYAAYGLQQLIRILFEKLAALTKKVGNPARRQGWVMSGVVCVVIYLSVQAAVNFVAVSSHEPDFYVPAQAGFWLKTQVTEKDAIWVLNDHPFQSYALATYVQLPFDTILDDRYDSQFIHASLASARLVYIVELYKSKDGLSAEESTLLAGLENGRIPAQRFPVGPTRVWVVSKDALVSPVSMKP